MNSTSIEWCSRPETRGPAGAKTWNPIRARLAGTGPAKHPARSGTFCTRISPGCQHCYASTINKRFGNGLEFTVPNLKKIEFFVDERILQEPLKQKKPCTIFVGDMFDLFHEAIPQEMVAEVLRVAWKLPRHTFQFLTKRAELMRRLVNAAQTRWDVEFGSWMWFGVSVESQPYADARIPELLQTRCAVRFLSVEPMLEAVDVRLPDKECNHPSMDGIRGTNLWTCTLCGGFVMHENHPTKSNFVREVPGVSWVVCGGESGPGARPFNLAWAEFLLEQCKAAGVPFFMKQMGSFPYDSKSVVGTYANAGEREAATLHERIKLRDRKGGDPSEWPGSLRVREFPAVETREAVTA